MGKSKTAATGQAQASVYIGRERLGRYVLADEKFSAFGASGEALGMFDHRGEALSAIREAARETVTDQQRRRQR